jgi:(1->4)-alpha-D-glucan 1-alpha-D-glucosylmutase
MAQPAKRVMNPPRATMRLQFHKGFTFDDAAHQVSYLAALDVSHLYASPIMTARAGSRHGYDVIDPTRVNPELGGEQAFRRLIGALRHAGLGMIVDIVPNHMAVGGGDNAWWLDVLQYGAASPTRSFSISTRSRCVTRSSSPSLGGPMAMPWRKARFRWPSTRPRIASKRATSTMCRAYAGLPHQW